MPLPVSEPKKTRRTKCVPPNPVYTSPESMKFLQQKDKDVNINFDEGISVNVVRGQGRGRGTSTKGRSAGCATRQKGGKAPVMLRKCQTDFEFVDLDEDEVGPPLPIPKKNGIGTAGKSLPVIEGSHVLPMWYKVWWPWWFNWWKPLGIIPIMSSNESCYMSSS